VLVAIAVLASPALAQRRPAIDTVPARDTREGDGGGTRVAARILDASEGRGNRSENLEVIALSDRWGDVPQQHRLKLSVQITDGLTELGNLIGSSMNDLSNDMLGLQFDGRRRRAKLRLGTGEGSFLRFKLESDWHFTQGKARVAAKLQLGIGSHQWNIELPDMEMVPASYRGERGVEVRVPLFERRW